MYLNKWDERDLGTSYEQMDQQREELLEQGRDAIELKQLIVNSGGFGSRKFVTPAVMMNAFKDAFDNSVRIRKFKFYYGSLRQNPADAKRMFRSLLKDVLEPYMYGAEYVGASSKESGDMMVLMSAPSLLDVPSKSKRSLSSSSFEEKHRSHLEDIQESERVISGRSRGGMVRTLTDNLLAAHLAEKNYKSSATLERQQRRCFCNLL